MAGINAIAWFGLRDHDPLRTSGFLGDAFELHMVDQRNDFVVLLLPSGQTAKIYHPRATPAAQAATTMVGLLTDDLPTTVARAQAAGAEPVGPLRTNELYAQWQHLRIPGGHIIDITYRPPDWRERLLAAGRPYAQH